MIPGAEGSRDQLSEMQLAGRLVLSAAALLVLTLAYRYYKSRGSPGRPQEGPRGAAKASPEGESMQPLASRRVEREERPQGVRHRGVQRKESQPNGPAAPWPTEPGGLTGTGTSGIQGAPAGQEEGQARGKEKCPPGPGSPADRQRLVPPENENQERKTSRTLLSTDRMAELKADSQVAFPGLCRPSCPSGSHCEGPGWGAGCGEAAPDLPPSRSQQASAGPLQTSGEESALCHSGQWPLAGGEGTAGHPGPTEVTLLQREKVPAFQARSAVGLAISQPGGASCAGDTSSSLAETQEVDRLTRERQSKENSSGQAQPSQGNLRGRVCDYHVQAVTMEKSSSTSLDTPQSYDTSTTDIPPESESGSQREVPSAFSQNDEDGEEVQKVPPPSPGASEDDEKPRQPEEQKGAGIEGSPSQKSPELRYGLRRKESFHKIVENPDLQVPMEGFGSSALGTLEQDTPPPGPLHSASVSSLLESMRSIQSDASEGPTVELVAGAKFLHFPLSSETPVDVVHLDLGNCYEVLRLAKEQKLEALREAAYKVMSNNYLQVLRTHAIYGRLNAMERDLILQKRMRGRKHLAVVDVSSQEPSSHASRLCYYDDRADTWHPLTHLPVEAISKGCAICSMFNYLFVAAGCEGRGRHQRPSNRVFCYNPLTNIWREVCPLNQARPHCKLVALDGYLYAIGGECLYTVERYDPRMDRWSYVAPLPNDTFAVAHTAAACDGEIYVTGGTLRYILLRYVPRLDAWKVSLTGGSKDRTTEMVAAGGFIYRFDLNRNMGIGVYRCSPRAKLWYECATLPVPFPASFQCAVVENLVYCVSRQFHLRFLADHISPRFGAKELKHFPSARGVLVPAALVLPDKDAAQTRV
ncbi:hypothetical protein JRQ81_009977 [Phrynocephalus forsythii]|uniref:Kelch domain-containing protein 7A n=1 Tax=Phrynocephalus forsythii TaxID=171643 RepID=A0A9Q0X946_9SAUR|nr:hypothetical protein JRQ81_009977 [Phrynocephalus forsythii]